MKYIKAFLGAAISFFTIDIVWITTFVRPYYEQTIGHLLRESPDIVASVGFYLAYIGGIVVLAIAPALAAARLRTAAINGAVLGAVGYGTYSFTNYAVFEGWTPGLVVSDIAWGTFLTAVAAVCGYLVARR